MSAGGSGIPDDVRARLAEASQLAKAVDDAITAAVPEIEDLQVAAAAGGMVVISGVVHSDLSKGRAEATARGVDGVQKLINSLMVR